MNGVPGCWRLSNKPCRTPMTTHVAQRVLTNLPPGHSLPIPDGRRGEAGTLAIARVDIH